jgi:hypothetical protein
MRHINRRRCKRSFDRYPRIKFATDRTASDSRTQNGKWSRPGASQSILHEHHRDRGRKLYAKESTGEYIVV